VVTCGGRVLCVAALGKNLREARDIVYAVVRNIHWDGMLYRRDIGTRAILRETTAAQ
jgi:Phosphoribosylamine-glycine ligase